MVERFTANFSESCSEEVSGRLWAAEGNSKPCKPFSPTQYHAKQKESFLPQIKVEFII